MGPVDKVIQLYEKLLDEVSAFPSEDWALRRRTSNAALRLLQAQLLHHDEHAKHGIENPLTSEHRASVKKAIELRREIYRRRKEMRL